jgi:hypothetical protein
MIQTNWDIFSAKFSTNKETTFEWFAYLLFCREFNLPKGWFGFKNQSGIEKNPIEHERQVIGFQAKFYSTSLSDHKEDFIEMLVKAKRDYPNLTKILIYTNQLWGQAHNKKENKMASPRALVDIETKAKELNILLEWREASFFESEFVTLEHDDLSKYFFTEEPLQGWQRYDDWSNTKTNIEDEYFIDNDIKVITPQNKNNSELNVVDGIKAIRDKLSTTGTSVRLVGLSGVGKTRFAQALFDDRIGENNLDVKNVWYCDVGDSPNPLPEHFIEELKLKNKPFILIVDNCGQDTHANLTKKIQSTEISLLTIEYDVKDDLPERTDVYKLQPNSIDIVQKVIERHYPDVNDLNSRKIAEFSGGNYRLALAIASNIEKSDNLALLTDSELFERLFWQKGQRNDELFKIAKNFALVYSFNIEDSGEENSELDFLANLAKVDSDSAIEAIETLKNKDIVQQRGIWRAILPHALANHLAKELISNKLVNQLDQLTKRMPERLQLSFIKRLSYLHDVPKVGELVTSWFADEGWLGKKILEGSYNDQDLVKIRLLAQISEEQLLNLLEQKHYADPSFFIRENKSFVELSRLLRVLAYQEHNFEKAFNLLVYFAKDEKANERNNSVISLVASLFRLYTSETLANLEQKKEALTLLKSKIDYLPILLACLSKALNFHEYGYFIRESNESGRTSDYGYQPKTYQEIWAWVDFLLKILNELDKQGVVQARKIFVNHLKEIIWTCRKVDIAKEYLEEFNKRGYFSEAYTQILNIIKWNEDELKEKAPQLLIDLENLEQQLRPKKHNIGELIKTYILVSDHDLYRMTRDTDDELAIKIPDFDNYENLIKFISDELQNITILKENVALLAQSNSGWINRPYLIELGEKSVHVFRDIDECIETLQNINIDENLNFSEFLLGILNGFKQSSSEDYYSLISFLLEDPNLKHMASMLIFNSCKNDDDYIYISQLIHDEKFFRLSLPSLAFCKFHKKITNQNFELILDKLIEKQEWDIVHYELLMDCSFNKCVSEKYQDILLRHSYDFLSNDDFLHDFEAALMHLLQYDEDAMFNNIKKIFNAESYIWFHREDKKFKILKILIEHSTDRFIKYFVEDSAFLLKFFNKDLAKILVYADSKIVLNWINKNQEKINFWAENSRLYTTKNPNKLVESEEKIQIIWNNLLIELLNISEDKLHVIDIIIRHQILKMSGVFGGSRSQAMSSRLPYFDSLRDKLETQFPEVLKLIDTRKNEWQRMISGQAKADEQDEMQSIERFDW